ncbi:MAG: TusE/DsrC/DsvC family sulfur relay protein [Acidimicrobiia bacterium]
MPTQTVAGHQIDVDPEGFLTNPAQWSEDVAAELARQIGIDELTEDHWKVIRFLRKDYEEQGETAQLRRTSTMSGVGTKELYVLFPKKPAKKMAYVAGLPKPHGCV